MLDRYTGYISKYLNEQELELLYKDQLEIELLENQYLIVEGADGNVVDYFKKKGGRLQRVGYPVLENEFSGQLKPRNPQQYCAWDMLKDPDIGVKLITGCFGSGKSIACIVGALEAVLKGKFEKIVFVRNNVQVKDTDQLGSLPGTADDKMLPYLMPVADHTGGIEGVRRLIDAGQLEVIPLGFLRGRSIRNSIIYSMESENLSKEHIQLLMGRVDEGSQLWLDGDFKQRDRASFEKSQGLETMVDALKGDPLFGYVHLVKSERSNVAALADKLD